MILIVLNPAVLGLYGNWWTTDWFVVEIELE